MTIESLTLEDGAVWVRIASNPELGDIWTWYPRIQTIRTPEDPRQSLADYGWQRIDIIKHPALIDVLHGQLSPVLGVHPPNQAQPEAWAWRADIEHALKVPVILAFPIPDEITAIHPAGEPLILAQVVPPEWFGVYGLVITATKPTKRAMTLYSVQQTRENDELQELQALQKHLGEALTILANSTWPFHSRYLTELMRPDGYGHLSREYAQRSRHARTETERQKLRRLQAAIDALRDDAEAMTAQRERIDRDRGGWEQEWKAAHAMAQKLADAYWAMHQRERTTRSQSLPALTSGHRTLIPSHNAARALMQSFAPGVQPSLWNLDPDNATIELHTPNNSLIQVTPQDGRAEELAVLHRYVQQGLSPEGIKHVVGILATYADQTGGAGQKIDARVSIRQLLLRMGKPESHVDSPEEQRRVYQTILYLARCLVRASDRPEEPHIPGSARKRKGAEYREYSPMLVIERVQFEEDGSLRVPREVQFHLGADYYHLLFGEGRNFFSIPTPLVLSYHPDREQHELLLAMYLSDMIAWNRNPWRVSFQRLMLQSALTNEEELAHGQNRLRDALRVCLALEHLERDGLLLRSAHSDVDTALSCELAQGNITTDMLSEATRTRIAEQPYHTITATADSAMIRTRRRRALQNLLNRETLALTLAAGPLLREQVRQREAKRKEATVRNEQLLVQRVVKNATERVFKASQDTKIPRDMSSGTKRHGRPRKS